MNKMKAIYGEAGGRLEGDREIQDVFDDRSL